MSIVTNNWGSIQKKSIDPYSDVASDITSRLTKIIGTDNAYINGFDIIKLFSDMDNDGIFVQLSPGIGVISNIVIDINQDSTIRLSSFPVSTVGNYYLVLEYIYAKTMPPPIAQIRGIPESEYDSRIHLRLYQFTLNGWNAYVNTDIVKLFINDNPNRFIDMRNRTGYIPRIGGTYYGGIFLDERIYEDHKFDNNEYVTKYYVNNYIKDSLNDLINEEIAINFKCALLDLLMNCEPVRDTLRQVFMELVNGDTLLEYDGGAASTEEEKYVLEYDNDFAIINMMSFDHRTEGVYYNILYKNMEVVRKYNGGYASWLHDCDCELCFDFGKSIINFIGTVEDELNKKETATYPYNIVPIIYSGGNASTKTYIIIYSGGVA